MIINQSIIFFYMTTAYILPFIDTYFNIVNYFVMGSSYNSQKNKVT